MIDIRSQYIAIKWQALMLTVKTNGSPIWWSEERRNVVNLWQMIEKFVITESVVVAHEGYFRALHASPIQQKPPHTKSYWKDLRGVTSGSYFGEDHGRLVSTKRQSDKRMIQYFTEHIVIVSFVGSKPPKQILMSWIGRLQHQLNGVIKFGQHLDKGFLTPKASSLNMVRSLIMLTPHHSNFRVVCFSKLDNGVSP